MDTTTQLLIIFGVLILFLVIVGTIGAHITQKTKCPFCVEIVNKGAAKCPHCGEDLKSQSRS